MNDLRCLTRCLLMSSAAIFVMPGFAEAAEGTAATAAPEAGATATAEPAATAPTKPSSETSLAKSGDAPAPTTEPAVSKGSTVDQETLDEAIAGGSVVELPNKTYYFLGARYRGIVVPKFMINLFADGGRTVYVHAFGPEFGIRKNGFEYNLSTWLGLYDMKDTPFKGKSDDSKGWEIVSSSANTLFFSSDFLWSNEFTPGFSLTYGAGAGLGVVFGKVIRTEAYPPTLADANDPYSYVKCKSSMDGTADYCIDAGNKIGYNEPNWAHGGSKPLLFPWLTLQTGLRYKVHRNFVTRLDLGFGTSGFFFGLGADYGL